MNKYLVRYNAKETIQELEKIGEITYRSPVIDLVFVKTDKSIEDVREIPGVRSAEYGRVGRLLPVIKERK